MNKLANLKIGRKLTLLLASGLGPLVCVVGLTLWGLSTIRSAVVQQQAATDKMLIAQHAAANMGRVTSIVGHIALGSKCESCHGVATGGDREHQANIVKEYLSLLADLRARETNSDGQRLVVELETAGTHWHEVNTRVLQLSSERKQKESVEMYRSESIPGYAPVDKALQEYLKWQQPREAQAVERVSSFTRNLPLAVALLALTGLTGGLLLGILLTRSIANPLRAMQAAAGKLALGDVNVDLELESKDELGALAHSFRVMTGVIKNLISEVEMLTKAAVAGKLATRGNADQFQGGYRQIVAGVNQTLDAVIGPVSTAAKYVDRISKGDIPPAITDHYNGDFNELKNNLNNCIGNINALAADSFIR